jgi:hypothetical protein
MTTQKQEQLGYRTVTLYQVLEEANKSDTPVDVLKTHISKDVRIAPILGYALNPNFKIPLPEGIPPYKPSDTPLGVAEIEVLNLQRQIQNVLFSRDIQKVKKEHHYIQWLEKLPPQEAELLIAIKDQAVPTMFSKLTEEVLVTAMGWPMDKFLAMKGKK